MKQYLINTLKNNGLAILATDTLYGILGNAYSPEVVQRIYTIKGRDEVKPFIILIHSIENLKEFGVELSESEKNKLRTFWPGMVTIILPVNEKDQERLTYLHRGTKELAFRLPAKPSLLEILKETGPLVAPSANPQGIEPAHTIAEAKAYFGEMVDYYEDEGVVEGQPSTIIRMQDGVITVIRQGAVSIIDKMTK